MECQTTPTLATAVIVLQFKAAITRKRTACHVGRKLSPIGRLDLIPDYKLQIGLIKNEK